METTFDNLESAMKQERNCDGHRSEPCRYTSDRDIDVMKCDYLKPEPFAKTEYLRQLYMSCTSRTTVPRKADFKYDEHVHVEKEKKRIRLKQNMVPDQFLETPILVQPTVRTCMTKQGTVNAGLAGGGEAPVRLRYGRNILCDGPRDALQKAPLSVGGRIIEGQVLQFTNRLAINHYDRPSLMHGRDNLWRKSKPIALKEMTGIDGDDNGESDAKDCCNAEDDDDSDDWKEEENSKLRRSSKKQEKIKKPEPPSESVFVEPPVDNILRKKHALEPARTSTPQLPDVTLRSSTSVSSSAPSSCESVIVNDGRNLSAEVSVGIEHQKRDRNNISEKRSLDEHPECPDVENIGVLRHTEQNTKDKTGDVTIQDQQPRLDNTFTLNVTHSPSFGREHLQRKAKAKHFKDADADQYNETATSEETEDDDWSDETENHNGERCSTQKKKNNVSKKHIRRKSLRSLDDSPGVKSIVDNILEKYAMEVAQTSTNDSDDINSEPDSLPCWDHRERETKKKSTNESGQGDDGVHSTEIMRQEHRDRAIYSRLDSAVYLSKLTVEQHAMLTKNSPRAKKQDKYVTHVKCDICRSVCEGLQSMDDHLDKHHGASLEKPFKCEVCQETFGNKTELLEHIFMHWTDDKPCQCRICGICLQTSKELRYHRRDLHDPNYGCLTCGLRFPTTATVREHMASNEGHRPDFQCEICDRIMKTEKELKVHIEFHEKGKPYQCSVCDYSTDQPSALKIHTSIHFGTKESKCPLCDTRFLNIHRMNAHVREKHEEKTFLCSLCGKAFARMAALKKHSLDHEGKRMKCTVKGCQKRFVSEKGFQEHMKSHDEGARGFQCATCGKKFERACSLKSHMDTHSDEMPFECSECGKKFKRKHNVESHMRTHTKVRDFGCDICGERFRWKHNMENHMKTHTGEKP